MGEERALPTGRCHQEQAYIATSQVAGNFQGQRFDVGGGYRANSRTDSRGALRMVRTDIVQKTIVAATCCECARGPKSIERLDDTIGVDYCYPTTMRLQASRFAPDQPGP
jgi:hypothetical protein